DLRTHRRRDWRELSDGGTRKIVDHCRGPASRIQRPHDVWTIAGSVKLPVLIRESRKNVARAADYRRGAAIRVDGVEILPIGKVESRGACRKTPGIKTGGHTKRADLSGGGRSRVNRVEVKGRL